MGTLPVEAAYCYHACAWLHNLLNPRYQPCHEAEWQNFYRQQAFMFTVLISVLMATEARRLVPQERKEKMGMLELFEQT
jgi:hypothetical protein